MWTCFEQGQHRTAQNIEVSLTVHQGYFVEAVADQASTQRSGPC